MRKIILFSVVISLLALPAFAQTINWDGGNQSCAVNVSLAIPMWAQVVCQGSDGITFSPATATAYNSNSDFNGSNGDWWGTSWDGFYAAIGTGCDNKASTDAWAGASYISGGTEANPTGLMYEATDYAHHFVRTNTAITGSASCTNLTTGSYTIPARFTIAFGAFYDAGSQINVLTFPGSSDVGAYGAGTDGGTITMTGGSPQTFTNVQYGLTPPAWGTVTFHSRILRRGMIDVAGTYTGTISVSYN